MQRPFADPGRPSVDQATAVAAALKLVDRVDGGQVDKTELRVVFTQLGVQRPAWNIYLSDIVDVTSAGQQVPGYWIVEIDAVSGAAALLASGRSAVQRPPQTGLVWASEARH